MHPPPIARRRRALLLAALFAPAVVCAAPLPQRNLVVEVRVADDLQTQEQARAGGMAVIDSRGGVAAAGGVQPLGRTQRAGEAVQRVLVLNGQRARVQLSRTLPLNDAEVAWTPWGAAAALRMRWVDLVDGFDVWPRWSGGEALVLVEIGAQRGGAGLPGANAPPPQAGVFTTVQAPLSQWVDIATLQQPGTVAVSPGLGAATARRVQRLQLRVMLA
jgi:hypothetical protein